MTLTQYATKTDKNKLDQTSDLQRPLHSHAMFYLPSRLRLFWFHLWGRTTVHSDTHILKHLEHLIHTSRISSQFCDLWWDQYFLATFTNETLYKQWLWLKWLVKKWQGMIYWELNTQCLGLLHLHDIKLIDDWLILSLHAPKHQIQKANCGWLFKIV